MFRTAEGRSHPCRIAEAFRPYRAVAAAGVKELWALGPSKQPEIPTENNIYFLFAKIVTFSYLTYSYFCKVLWFPL